MIKLSPNLVIIISGVLYGLLGYFGMNLINAGLSISTMLFWRFSVATVILFLFKRTLNKIPQSQSSIAWVPLGISSIFYGVSAVLYFLASQVIGTGLSMVLFFTYPAFVMALSWILDRNRITLFAVVSLCFLLLGLFFINNADDKVMDLFGVFIAVASAALYALYIYISKNQVKKIEPLLSTLLLCFSSSILFLVFSLIEGSFCFPDGFGSWVNVIAIATVGTALPAFMLLKGLQTVDSGVASILSVFEPVMTVLLGAFALGETLTQGQLVGIVTILLGTILIQFDKKPAEIPVEVMKVI
jgi:drug/metabolite transporter (DMT)-like permease